MRRSCDISDISKVVFTPDSQLSIRKFDHESESNPEANTRPNTRPGGRPVDVRREGFGEGIVAESSQSTRIAAERSASAEKVLAISMRERD